MLDFATISAGVGDAFTLYNLLFVIGGVALGQFVGAVPGLSAPMAIAIAVPFTFTLSPLAAISFLVGVGKGGTVGGAIPAVLINTPGTPDAAATALDGAPLARQGKPLKAMKMALYASVTGDTMSDIVLIVAAPPLAIVALQMGPVELTCLMIFSLTIITGLVGDSMAKGMIAAGIGVVCASVGLDPEYGTARMTFGLFQLDDGLPIAAVAIGVLAVGSIIGQLAQKGGATESPIEIKKDQPREDRRVSFAEYWACRVTMLRGATIGTIVGAIPGIGSSAAAFLSYSITQRSDKDPDSYGKGNIKGIAASESANSAVMGANLIPLLTLGIPGNVVAAMIVGAFVIQGIQPGPLLFHEQGRLIYGLFGTMMMANVMNLLIGQFGLRLWGLVVKAPASVIFPTALLLCMTGTFITTGGTFGVVLMLIFGVAGYFMRLFGFSVVSFIIAFVLAPQLELSLAQAMIITNGEPGAILHHPIGLAFLALSVLSFWWLGLRNPKKKMVA